MISLSRLRKEDGFSLMESVVAMAVVIILFVSVAVSLQVIMRHQRDVRLRQQAAALVIQELEATRTVAWNVLAMGSTAADDFNDGTDLLGASVDLTADEPLVIDTANGLVGYQDLAIESFDGQDFDVNRYVSDAGTDLRRIVVVVSWTANGVPHTEIASTLLAENGTGS